VKYLMKKCGDWMDSLEGGDLGIDEGWPPQIQAQIRKVVGELDTLKTMAAEEQIENEIDPGASL